MKTRKFRKFGKNKKGTALFNVFERTGEFFAMVLIIIFLLIILSKFNTQFSSVNGVDSTSINTVDAFNTKMPSAWDWAFPIIYLFFVGLSIWIAKLTASNPYMVIFGVVFMIFLTFTSLVLTDIYENMYDNNTDFASIADSMDITDFMIRKLVFLSLIYSLIVGIVLYTEFD